MKRQVTGSARKTTICKLSPEVSLELVSQGRQLLGLGKVWINGVLIRSATSLIRPDFSTPDAVHYQDFQLVTVERRGQQTVLHTLAQARPEVYGEIMDEYSYNLAFPKLRETETDQLDWLLEPQELLLDGVRYVGFSLGFRFASRQREIHRLTTVATWEIGGRATGNTIYHQSYTSAPVYTATKSNRFSTTCLKRLDLWNHWLGHSYQMLPRWGCIQPFDFQSSKEGVLLGYWKDPHSVKSLVQKNPGEDVVFVLDEYDFPLAKKVTTPAKHILFAAHPKPKQKWAKHEVVNMWTRACDHTSAIIRDFFGIKPCQPLVSGGPLYLGKNSVPRAELAQGPQPDWLWDAKDGKFYFLLEGERIESRNFLYWTADKILPRLHAQGIKRVMFEPVHESDFTEMGFAYHAQTGWHGDLVCSSICGSHRYVPAAFYDGWKGWNYLAQKAQALGISLGHWVGLHLTPRSPILEKHPEYILQHVNTLGHGGGYSHQFICSINWCSGAKQWFLDDMKRWHDEGGLEWLFFDSWPNLGCSPLNYGGRMEPMQWELGDVLAKLQQIGYNWFSFEGTSPFGVHQYGLWDPMTDYKKHTSGGVMGQNDFGLWVGHEYMGYNQALGPGINALRDQSTLAEMSFRYLANRSLTLVMQDLSGRNQIPPENQFTYQTLQPLMQKRFMLPNDQGVLWQAENGRQVLFAYKAFSHKLPSGVTVNRVHGTAQSAVPTPGDVLPTTPWSAYLIG